MCDSEDNLLQGAALVGSTDRARPGQTLPTPLSSPAQDQQATNSSIVTPEAVTLSSPYLRQ